MSSAGAAPCPAPVAGAGYRPCTLLNAESGLSLSSHWDIVVHVVVLLCVRMAPGYVFNESWGGLFKE